MLATILDTVFNGLLIGTSGYAMCSLKPLEHPFGFAASAVGFCHGCMGICTLYFNSSFGSEGSEVKCLNRVKKITTSCMEIISVPMINMELYSHSQQTSALALGHGLFIIPLAFDLAFTIFASHEAEDDATEILKDLTILGNIVSISFFAINENNLPAGIMGETAFFAYFGSNIMESVLSGTGENSKVAGFSLFFALIPQAIRASSSVGVS